MKEKRCSKGEIITRSVLAFVNKTNSEIHYLAEEKRFRVRMIV